MPVKMPMKTTATIRNMIFLNDAEAPLHRRNGFGHAPRPQTEPTAPGAYDSASYCEGDCATGGGGGASGDRAGDEFTGGFGGLRG
jgi:hypothetical protein